MQITCNEFSVPFYQTIANWKMVAYYVPVKRSGWHTFTVSYVHATEAQGKLTVIQNRAPISSVVQTRVSFSRLGLVVRPVLVSVSKFNLKALTEIAFSFMYLS